MPEQAAPVMMPVTAFDRRAAYADKKIPSRQLLTEGDLVRVTGFEPAA